MSGAERSSLRSVIGKALLAWYLSQRDVASVYGAAGSLIVILLWVYSASQILFFGAEYTKAYAQQYHAAIAPRAYAEFIDQIQAHPSIVGELAGALGVLLFEWKAIRWYFSIRRFWKRLLR